MKKNRVIFYAFTPYHLFVSVYYAMQVKWEKRIKRCLIWYDYSIYTIDISKWEKYFDDIIVITDVARNQIQRLWSRSLYGGILFSYSPVSKFLSKQWDDNILICFSDQNDYVLRLMKEIKKHHNNLICLVEEGEGTYAYNMPAKEPSCKRIIKKLLGLETGNYIGHSKLEDTWVVQQIEKLPKEKSIGKRVVQQNSIFLDKAWTRHFDFLLDGIQLPLHSDKKIILWVSGPLTEHGVSEQEELTWLQEIVDTVSNDYIILIKRHPRERKQKYQNICKHPCVAEVDLGKSSWIPFEFLAGKLNSQVVITVSSSVLYHLYESGYSGKLIFCFKHFKNLRVDKSIFEPYSNLDGIYSVSTIKELKDVIYGSPQARHERNAFMNYDKDIRYLEGIQNDES